MASFRDKIGVIALPETGETDWRIRSLGRTGFGEANASLAGRATRWPVFRRRINDRHSAGDRRVAALFVGATGRERSETGRSPSEERLQRGLRAARRGLWTLDVARGQHTRDANRNQLLDLNAVETTQPFEEFLSHIHPDDQRTVRAAFEAASRSGQNLNVEFRIVRPDSAVRWLQDQDDILGESDAETQHMAGACVDVTERREAEEASRAGEERLRLILSSATDFAIFTLDPERRVTDWTSGAEDLRLLCRRDHRPIRRPRNRLRPGE